MLLFAVAAVAAQLAPLATPAEPAETLHQESFFGGGEGAVAKPAVTLTQADLSSADGDALRLELHQSGASLEASLPAFGLPANWREHGKLVLRVRPDAPLTLQLVVLLPRGRLIAEQAVAAGETTDLPLRLDDLPLAAGTQPLYEPTGIRIIGTWSDDASRVCTLTSLTLEPREQPPPPVVDALGQRRNADWPGKVRSVEELKERAFAEAEELSREAAGHAPAPEPLDRFGGWRGGQRFHASGFFRVERDPQGIWWLVTPEGHPFWSIGTTGVRVGSVNDTARAVGREALFESLPAVDDPAWFAGRQPNTLGDLDLAGNVHFYRWNVLRKYDTLEAWRDRVLSRWTAWGLNSLGAWSDELVLQQERVPHTRFLRARAAIPGVPAVNGFPDVWDSRWEAWVDAEFARETVIGRHNPWLIGYFVDNEAHWRDMRLLDMAQGAVLRDAWRDFARAQYGSLERFNAEWQAACASWEEVRALTMAAAPPPDSSARAVLAAFEAAYAERYFSTVARLLKRHDPDHLYLGARFVRQPPAEAIVAAAGRHVDVLSVNCYARVPEPAAFEAWHRMSGGRPILIGEFHFPLASDRQLPPPWQAFEEAEREQMFVEFVRVWTRQPWSIGCHWYQHADQPATGRHTDGENQTVGIVDITDTPYDHMVRAARAASAEMYRWHATAAIPTDDQ